MQMLKEKKMKKIVLLLTVLAFAFTSFGPVWAADKGNKRKGKYTYRKVYNLLSLPLGLYGPPTKATSGRANTLIARSTKPVWPGARSTRRSRL